MRKVLVTGADGFVGRGCIPRLALNYDEVHLVSRHIRERDTEGINWHSVDLFDQSSVSQLVDKVRPTHLLHLAWITAPGDYWDSLENIRWVVASIHLIYEFAIHGGKRVVVAGSCAEYDWSKGLCCESTTPLTPVTLYGQCKNALRFTVEGIASGLGISAAWGRFFFLYGPGENPKRLVASTIRALLAGKSAPCTIGTQQRDFLYVEDAADGLVALLNSDAEGAFNIASGQAVTVSAVVGRIGTILRVSDLISLGVLARRPNEPECLVADIERISHVLGWLPRYDLDKGLRLTIDWWASRNSGVQ